MEAGRIPGLGDLARRLALGTGFGHFYFVVALAFWVSMLYSAYAATSVELDPSSTYTSLI